ncbi:MAG: TolC family protein, partial [Desulfobulbaceae bacterium]|nr:TolC family protein [Desulfobulbaceae bacterium]
MSAPFFSFSFVRSHFFLALTISALALTACAVGPDYRQPKIDVPAAWKENPPAGWKMAQPQDTDKGSQWWKIYHEPRLDELVARIEISNQNVAAAAARHRQAVALLGAASAAFFPTANLGATANRAESTSSSESLGTNGGNRSRVNSSSQVSLNLGWEIDL